MRDTTIRKYRAIQERYKELYHVQQLRGDVVMSKLQEEFFIAEINTIYRILNTEI
jgi:hypothetical protein